MTSELFLTCFLACTFSFVMLGVLGYQIVTFFIRRGIKKHLPKILEEALHNATGAMSPATEAQMAEARVAFEQLMTSAKKTPAGVVPHLPTVTCCRCAQIQIVPVEENLGPYLENRDWRFVPKFGGWACGSCIAKASSVGPSV